MKRDVGSDIARTLGMGTVRIIAENAGSSGPTFFNEVATTGSIQSGSERERQTAKWLFVPKMGRECIPI